VVRPPATTEPPVDTAGDPNAVVEGTQEYTVQAGDYPYLLVERFAITLDDLIAVNEWTSANDFPGPGTVILIPPGAKSVDAVATAATDTGTGTGTDTGATTDTATSGSVVTIPDAGDNCSQGTYTIVDGDYPGKVASKFDVTVDALNAANAATPGYSSFYVGLEIVIPAKSDC
jgi:LysM repeat protein